jgi:3-keto-disaccharide hydrolase
MSSTGGFREDEAERGGKIRSLIHATPFLSFRRAAIVIGLGMRLISLRFIHLASLVLGLQALADETPNQLSPEEKAGGWGLLFDGQTTKGWHSFKHTSFPAKGWVVEDGWLHCLGKEGGDVLSDVAYDQFDLQWEWKLEPGGNSGLKYFVLDSRNSAIGHEYQMLDDQRNPDGKLAEGKRVTASFYDVLKPGVAPPSKPLGEINQSRVLVKGNHVEHWLNGVKVLEYECGSEAVKAAVAESKFKNVPGFGNRVKGHLLLQDHHSNVWFRSIKIRDLSDSK